MNRILGLVMFLVFFFLAYLGLHYYVFWRFSGFFGLHRGILFYVLMVLLAASFPVMSIIARYSNNVLTRIFYTLSGIWLGALFIAFWVLLIYEVIRLFFNLSPVTAGIVVFVVVIFLVVYSVISASFVSVKEVKVRVKNLDKELKVVQISDVHIGTVHNEEYLQKIVDKINKVNPDIVLITGDLFDGGGDVTKETLAPLNNISAKIFFTTGNHEQYEGLDDVFAVLKTTKVNVLRNEIVNYKEIQIIGVDNPSNEFSKTIDALSRIKINKSKPSILMYHPPSGYEDAKKAGISLQLSGHAHDGQIFPLNYLWKLFYPKVYGLYDLNGTYLYISAGTGTWGPPMRLGSRSEITVIKLVKK